VKTLLLPTVLILALLSTDGPAATLKPVTFESQGQTLAGSLYLPDGYTDGQKLPGVVVTGAWTTVKEQMAGTYAAEMADRGYVALGYCLN
jgi:fermentation-respiration switch protein FrsA (DUF1100 family)